MNVSETFFPSMARRMPLVVVALAVQTFAVIQSFDGRGQYLGKSRSQRLASPCTPTAEQLHVLRPKKRLHRSGLTFYLHDQGAFNFSDMERCYLEALGTDNLLSNIDEVAYPNTAQHSTDLLVLRQLREHSGRVLDPSMAQIHIIGSPIGASHFAAQLPGAPCGGMDAHYRRVRSMLNQMQNNGFFQENQSNWMLIDTDWDLDYAVLPGEFVHMFETVPMLLATVDQDISAQAFVEPNRTIVMPYNAHGLLDLPDDMISMTEPADRQFSFYFHGEMWRVNEGAERSILLNITTGLDQSSIEGASSDQQDVESKVNLTSTTARQMQDSVFCFIPAGDTPSSRRLFDALAAGCVPIIFNNDPESMPDLPFHHTIDWTEIAYFGGALDCVVDHVDLVQEWLEDLWSNHDQEVIRKMQQLGREAFVKTLSYRQGDLATAMLVEVDSVLNPVAG